MTCFSCAALVFRYSKRARTFFTKYVPSNSFRSHVTWNSAVPDLNVWCCILLFLCTLAVGHWYGEISSNVTFAYCTKGRIDVAVLRGRPLTRVDAKPKFIYRTFPFFFLHKNLQRGCINGKKVRCFKGRHTFEWKRRLQEKDSLGAWSLTSPASASLRLFLHYELFFMRRDGLSILKACSYISYLKWVFGSHVTWNSAVPVPNVWCCIVLMYSWYEHIAVRSYALYALHLRWWWWWCRLMVMIPAFFRRRLESIWWLSSTIAARALVFQASNFLTDITNM